MKLPQPPDPPPNELAVVGEHKDDPELLLLRDAEGRYYAYDPPAGDPEPVDPGDEWDVEPVPTDELFT
jgi:hypothetical protein